LRSSPATRTKCRPCPPWAAPTPAGRCASCGPSAARLTNTSFFGPSKQETNMQWIHPDSLPEVAGSLERFVLNRHGEVDGFVMNGQTQTPILVHTPPHMEGELVGNMNAGDKHGSRGK